MWNNSQTKIGWNIVLGSSFLTLETAAEIVSTQGPLTRFFWRLITISVYYCSTLRCLSCHGNVDVETWFSALLFQWKSPSCLFILDLEVIILKISALVVLMMLLVGNKQVRWNTAEEQPVYLFTCFCQSKVFTTTSSYQSVFIGKFTPGMEGLGDNNQI